jgi:hypothetical protein
MYLQPLCRANQNAAAQEEKLPAKRTGHDAGIMPRAHPSKHGFFARYLFLQHFPPENGGNTAFHHGTDIVIFSPEYLM